MHGLGKNLIYNALMKGKQETQARVFAAFLEPKKPSSITLTIAPDIKFSWDFLPGAVPKSIR